MKLFDRNNYFFLGAACLLILAGFTAMKLDPVHNGYGALTLTVAPILIILGFVLGIVSIFAGEQVIILKKEKVPFIIAGWLVFLTSMLVYFLTMEETASLWDCSEFIACTYKLQVPHPPGAPLFMLVGKLFSFLSFGDTTKVAYWINMSSVFFSALSVMLTFQIIVLLGKRIIDPDFTGALILAGMVGSLSLAFADSFWFSALEAETYAMATFFLVLCFWSMLRWEQLSDSRSADKWLIFILYCLGLSVGVHPMGLLVLPALAVFFVFKYRKYSWKNLFIAIAAGSVGILFLNHVVLFGIPDLMKYADIFFVNSLSLPFYSGAILSFIMLLAGGIWAYNWSLKNQRRPVTILTMGMMYFLIGYSSYGLIIIRSQANPSIDEHNPENLISLASYLKRESYGSNPLLYGPVFNAKIMGYKKGAPVYAKGSDQYEIIDYKTAYEYGLHDEMLIPRMHSRQDRHIETYKKWTGIKEGERPGIIDNISFMIRYQFGHMYFRYLMFNFTGRASDIQHAAWLPPLDLFQTLPKSLAENKGRNNFLMLPFLLGIVGFWCQLRTDKAGLFAVMACFLFLGLILVLYLNSPPNEPRERDYIYVGSYFAFSLWIGLGVLALYSWIRKKVSHKNRWSYLACVALLVPVLMMYVGFDDHDRSGRTLQVDHARNTLASCAPNSILFTGGDNDTFPLWYVQEVEGFRTDVRVIVLSYFNGDWYIDQMRKQVYESNPLPFSLEREDYAQGGLNDILPYVENPDIKGAINLGRYLDLVKNKNKSLQVSMSDETRYNSIPSRNFFIEIDKNKALRIVPEDYREFIPEKLHMSWQGRFMEKSAFMVLDIIATNQWERPIYFNNTSLNSIAFDLKKSVLKEGMVYRLLPIILEGHGGINMGEMYANVMEKWQFHDLDNDQVYYNHEDYQLRILQATKVSYNELAEALLTAGEKDKASQVIDFVHDHFVKENIELDASMVATCDLLFRIEKIGAAKLLAEALIEQADNILQHIRNSDEIDLFQGQIQLFILRQLYDVATREEQRDLAAQCSLKYNEHYSLFTTNSF